MAVVKTFQIVRVIKRRSGRFGERGQIVGKKGGKYLVQFMDSLNPLAIKRKDIVLLRARKKV